MKNKKIRYLVVTFLIVLLTAVTINAAPANYDYYQSLEKDNLYNYIDKFKRFSNKVLYCIGRDMVQYKKLFSDEEKDYPINSYFTVNQKKTNMNNIISEIVKTTKSNGLEIKYEHNPTYYDNPVARNLKDDGRWHRVDAFFDSKINQWQLKNAPGSDFLFTNPIDSWRGEIKVRLRGFDDTGNKYFDKAGESSATIYVHKAPIPKFTVLENAGVVTLTDNGSYDYDYQYSKPNNGIKQYYWYIELDGKEWISIGQGRSVSYPTWGRTVTDYRLTVEDYDGAFTSISKKALILDEPDLDFNYTVGGRYADYAYKGNIANEVIGVHSSVAWNDEAYAPFLYTTSGNQTQKYTATKTGDYVSNINLPDWNALGNFYSNNVLQPKFNTLNDNKKIQTRFEASNRYDKTSQVTKDIAVKQVETVQKGQARNGDVVFEDVASDKADYTYVDTNKLTPAYSYLIGKRAVTVGNDVQFSFESVKDVADDLKGIITVVGRQLSTDPVYGRLNAVLQSGNINWDSPSNWDKINYTFDIYSGRTNQHLNTFSNSLLVHTPVTVTGTVGNMMTEEVFTLKAQSTKYARTIEAKFPFDVFEVTGVNPDGTPRGNRIPTGTKIQLNRVNQTDWSKDFYIPDGALADDATALINLYSTAENGRDADVGSVETFIEVIKIYDLKVIFTGDVNWRNYYFDSASIFKSGTEIKTNKMPANKNNLVDAPLGIKAGYNVHLFVTSKGLPTNNQDYVFLNKATFKKNGIEKSTVNENKKWVKVTQGNKNSFGFSPYVLSMIDSMPASEQLWYLKYTLPLNIESGTDVIFDIDGYKGNALRYHYNDKTTDTYQSGVEKGDVVFVNGRLEEDNRSKVSH